MTFFLWFDHHLWRLVRLFILLYTMSHHMSSNCCCVPREWKSLMCSIDVGNHYLAISLSFCHSVGKPCFSWKDDLLSSLSLTVRVCVHQEPQSSHCYFQRRMHCSMFPVMLRDACRRLLAVSMCLHSQQYSYICQLFITSCFLLTFRSLILGHQVIL